MIAVLDASAAIEIVLQREQTEKFTSYVIDADWVISPILFIAEVTNVFWKYQKLVDFPFLVCEKGIEQAIGLPDDFIDEKDIWREAFKLACNLNHSVYDMLYLVVARRNNGTLLTLDKKMIKAAQKCSIEVAF
ncbi:MAG: type II toxin-antitoxin system VapC family toxin [Thermodesulfobacteriota bacterium]|nr:type II toxin-antitoxin system VapC family toxin [Thermodesulfobacteriota bacterium]